MEYTLSQAAHAALLTQGQNGKQDADALPSAVLLHNGAAAATAVTVTRLSEGRYSYSFTVPAGWAVGDVGQLIALYTVDTFSFESLIQEFTVVSSGSAGDPWATDLGAYSGDQAGALLWLIWQLAPGLMTYNSLTGAMARIDLNGNTALNEAVTITGGVVVSRLAASAPAGAGNFDPTSDGDGNFDPSGAGT